MATYGVMGMLERMREPSDEGVVASSDRPVLEELWALLWLLEGVSRTRRRNCELFMSIVRF